VDRNEYERRLAAVEAAERRLDAEERQLAAEEQRLAAEEQRWAAERGAEKRRLDAELEQVTALNARWEAFFARTEVHCNRLTALNAESAWLDTELRWLMAESDRLGRVRLARLGTQHEEQKTWLN
jgi:hypothetical protein